MRAFIAVDLPQPIKAAIAEEQRGLRSALSRAAQPSDDVKWTRPEGIHLTLKFLGEISDQRATQVAEALAALTNFEPFSVEVKGFGFFPDARRPRVFWVRVEAPPGTGAPPAGVGHGQDVPAASALAQLAGEVEAAMVKLGFAPEGRAFSPHLTLARFKAPKPQPELIAALEPMRELALGRFQVSEFFLFESKLSPHGAEYRKVARFPQSSSAGI